MLLALHVQKVTNPYSNVSCLLLSSEMHAYVHTQTFNMEHVSRMTRMADSNSIFFLFQEAVTAEKLKPEKARLKVTSQKPQSDLDEASVSAEIKSSKSKTVTRNIK